MFVALCERTTSTRDENRTTSSTQSSRKRLQASQGCFKASQGCSDGLGSADGRLTLAVAVFYLPQHPTVVASPMKSNVSQLPHSKRFPSLGSQSPRTGRIQFPPRWPLEDRKVVARILVAARRALTLESLVPLGKATPPVLVIFHVHTNHSPLKTSKRAASDLSTLPCTTTTGETVK